MAPSLVQVRFLVCRKPLCLPPAKRADSRHFVGLWFVYRNYLIPA